MENRLWWIRYQLAFGYGTTKGHKILSEAGHPATVFQQPAAKLARSGAFTQNELRRIREATEEKAWEILRFCDDYGCEVLTPEDPGYPQRLREIYGYPAALYVLGSLEGLDDCLAIGMVGTRASTGYGDRAARTIARELAEKGAVIVSGMARGIDTASHVAALQAAGRTIAVMGCGIDQVYPPENAHLKMEIVRCGGAVVTEFPPGSQPLPRHFPIRNRVISGLSNGIVVVEGGRRSGSLITANHAFAQNRDVFAVPGSIFSDACAGSNFLLRQHAKAVDSVESILEEYQHLIQWEPVEAPEKNNLQAPSFSFEESGKNGYNVGQQPQGAAEAPQKEEPVAVQQPLPAYLSGNQQQIHSLLSDGQLRTTDAIASESGLSIPAVLSALTQMELLGLVEARPGRRFTVAGAK